MRWRPVPPVGRLPRITKLMALAIRFDQLNGDGAVKDQAELARLGVVTRARVTQIINLLNLAPEIQEELLTGSIATVGKDRLTERVVRHVVQISHWKTQQETLSKLGAVPLTPGY